MLLKQLMSQHFDVQNSLNDFQTINFFHVTFSTYGFLSKQDN